MKKECEQIRKQLRRYLRGHVFATERKRIERHLKSCPLCATEYQSLKHADETTQFLKDITPPEGLVGKVKAGVSGMSAARKILYRPLWIIAAVAALFAAFHYGIHPYLREQEREWQELSAQSAPPAIQPPSVAAPPAPQKPVEQVSVPPVKNPDPLVVTITVDDERNAVRRINDVMKGHGTLRTARFSDSVRQISASLTARELLTFFNRIETVGKISYSRTRFEEFPSTQPLPFIMRLKAAPGPTAKTAERAARPSPNGLAARQDVSVPPASAEQSAPKSTPDRPQGQ